MLVGHERREGRREERETFGARGNADRYQMREKLLSIGDDFWIEDESGRRAFKVNGKALRLRKTLPTDLTASLLFFEPHYIPSQRAQMAAMAPNVREVLGWFVSPGSHRRASAKSTDLGNTG